MIPARAGRPVLLLALCALLGAACNSIYYSAMEKVGVEKRDLLKKRVVAARDEQEEAGEQFKDALTRLKEISGFEGGRLESAYNGLKGEYDDCHSKAEAVRERIRSMETVADDLFAEWEKELGQYSSSSAALRDSSRRQLAETRARYEDVHRALAQAEQSMEPVLTQFHDYVLYLKHNLNAQAVASLKGEAASIENEIGRLIEQMNASIAKADAFVKTLP